MKNPLKANMPLKKTLSLGFVAMLLLTIAMVMVPASVVAVPAQSIWIDPTYPDPSVTNLEVSDTFTVDVMVNVTSPTSPGGTGLFGWEYKFKWNNTVLDAISIDTHGDGVPGTDLLPGHTSVFVLNLTTDLGDGRDQHWYGVSMLTGSVFTGVASLCTYTFKVIWEPIFPVPDYVGLLDIQDAKLVDDTATIFVTDMPPTPVGTVQDGMYEVASKVLATPMLEVQPSLVEGVFGQNFTVNIRIEGLDAAFNLSSWEATLGYNTTMLDALVSAEGPFLPGFAGTNGTYYNSTINDTLGIVDIDGGFNGSYTEPSGSGVLATVTFNASWRYTIPPGGGVPPVTSALNLYDTTLLDDEGLAITHDITDGTYNAPYEDENPPTIEIPARDPAGDVLPVAVYISVNVSDAETGVKNVTLSYTINNGTSWTELKMEKLAAGTYATLIPEQPAGTWVKFNITAYDNAGNSAERDGTDVHFVYLVVPEFPVALIMPLFIVATLMAVILGKTAWSKKRRSPFVASIT